MWDLNAKVEMDNAEYKCIEGKHEMEERNENSEW